MRLDRDATAFAIINICSSVVVEVPQQLKQSVDHPRIVVECLRDWDLVDHSFALSSGKYHRYFRESLLKINTSVEKQLSFKYCLVLFFTQSVVKILQSFYILKKPFLWENNYKMIISGEATTSYAPSYQNLKTLCLSLAFPINKARGLYFLTFNLVYKGMLIVKIKRGGGGGEGSVKLLRCNFISMLSAAL